MVKKQGRELEPKTVTHFLELATQGEKEPLLEYIQDELLVNIPINKDEEEKLAKLIEELVENKK
jgi:hypothetical protein